MSWRINPISWGCRSHNRILFTMSQMSYFRDPATDENCQGSRLVVCGNGSQLNKMCMSLISVILNVVAVSCNLVNGNTCFTERANHPITTGWMKDSDWHHLCCFVKLVNACEGCQGYPWRSQSYTTCWSVISLWSPPPPPLLRRNSSLA